MLRDHVISVRPLLMMGLVVTEKQKRNPGLPKEPRKDNIVTTWRETRPSLSVARDELNQALGTSYGSSRIGEWERGARQPTAAALNYMIGRTLPVILEDYGLDAEDIEALVNRLTLVDESQH